MLAYLRTAIEMVGLWLTLWVFYWLTGDTLTMTDYTLSVAVYALIKHNKEAMS